MSTHEPVVMSPFPDNVVPPSAINSTQGPMVILRTHKSTQKNYGECIDDFHWLERESKVTNPEIETFTKDTHNFNEFLRFFLLMK